MPPKQSRSARTTRNWTTLRELARDPSRPVESLRDWPAPDQRQDYCSKYDFYDNLNWVAFLRREGVCQKPSRFRMLHRLY